MAPTPKDHDEVVARLLARDPELRAVVEANEPIVWLVTRLVQLRKQVGLTQGEVADRMGRKQAAIARLESGDQDPKWTTVVAYAQALGLAVGIAPPSAIVVMPDQLDAMIEDAAQRVADDVLERLRKREIAEALVERARGFMMPVVPGSLVGGVPPGRVRKGGAV